MFRIDKNSVIDATMIGSLARFINHSCQPNCYTKILSDEGSILIFIIGRKVVIHAKKNIKIGEELTYNYHFPCEEIKIPCFCGSMLCNGWMN